MLTDFTICSVTYGNGAGTGTVQSVARLALRVRRPVPAACGAVVPGIATATAALFLTVKPTSRIDAITTSACVWFVTPTSVG